jgi:hypothetical protein
MYTLNIILNEYYRITDNTKITDIFKFNIKNNDYISYSKLFKIRNRAIYTESDKSIPNISRNAHIS